MAKGQDLIKYITQRVVTYIDTPVEARRERRLERHNRAKEPWQTKWFGMVPFSMQMWAGKWRRAGQPLLRRAARLKLMRWRKGPRSPQDEKAHS
ncbi:YqzE family protein [Paenibacillus thiaminolyticus]|uniref:YqzE family protein n=1 Tax=Paenibacillus thiaminolyticus TaxID=49283 RepID=UPI003D26D8DE